METKLKIVPFEVELAKKIVAGEVAGKIKTRSGEDVKIISFKRILHDTPYPIVYFNETGRWELVTMYGKIFYYPDNKEDPADLVIELPVEAGINSPGVPLFKPFDRVLVRDSDKERWTIDFFVRLSPEYYVCLTNFWLQCIPYKGNEHLFDTTDAPNKQENEV